MFRRFVLSAIIKPIHATKSNRPIDFPSFLYLFPAFCFNKYNSLSPPFIISIKFFGFDASKHLALGALRLCLLILDTFFSAIKKRRKFVNNNKIIRVSVIGHAISLTYTRHKCNYTLKLSQPAIVIK